MSPRESREPRITFIYEHDVSGAAEALLALLRTAKPADRDAEPEEGEPIAA